MNDQEEKKLNQAVNMLLRSGFDTRKIIFRFAEALSKSDNTEDHKWADKLHEIANIGVF